MSDLALPHPGSRNSAAGTWRRLTSTSRQAFLGLLEGFETARRYERLAGASDAQLARLGITREDVPWFAMHGKPRSR